MEIHVRRLLIVSAFLFLFAVSAQADAPTPFLDGLPGETETAIARLSHVEGNYYRVHVSSCTGEEEVFALDDNRLITPSLLNTLVILRAELVGEQDQRSIRILHVEPYDSSRWKKIKEQHVLWKYSEDTGWRK